jgi:hypothetical protein
LTVLIGNGALRNGSSKCRVHSHMKSMRTWYFRHDGAPPHSSREVRNFLNYRFPGRRIGLCSPHTWPARSPDLSPLDYCVWGWMKELVYSVKVVTRDESVSRITPQTASEWLMKLQLVTGAQFTIERQRQRQPVLRPAVAFWKTSFKHRSVKIKGNLTKLTLHLCFKRIMYSAGLLFCSVYCQ